MAEVPSSIWSSGRGGTVHKREALVFGREPWYEVVTGCSCVQLGSLRKGALLEQIADELAKLARLRDEGVISDEEFAGQKEKLLRGGSKPDDEPSAIDAATPGPPTSWNDLRIAHTASALLVCFSLVTSSWVTRGSSGFGLYRVVKFRRGDWISLIEMDTKIGSLGLATILASLVCLIAIEPWNASVAGKGRRPILAAVPIAVSIVFFVAMPEFDGRMTLGYSPFLFWLGWLGVGLFLQARSRQAEP